MGWIHYDVVIPPPNTIDDLTNAQMIVIGTQYSTDVNRYEAYLTCLSNPEFAEVQNLKYHVDWIYDTLNKIQSFSNQLMNGLYQTGVDGLGDPIYNTPPTTQGELETQIDTVVDDIHINELGPAKIGYAVDQMVLYSQLAGTGDWTYYVSQVVI